MRISDWSSDVCSSDLKDQIWADVPSSSSWTERMKIVAPNFALGAIVRHRLHDFRGVVFDVDAEFANTEEWYRAIPEPMRPRRDQPFYHLLAENPQSYYVAYVSERSEEHTSELQSLMRISYA